MKILHIINTLCAGGAELQLVTLCRRLRGVGIDAAVAYLKEGRGSRPLRRDFEAMGVPVVYLGGECVWDGRYILRARRWVQGQEADILHTHLPRADLVGALLRAAGVAVPWVVSVHDVHSRSWRGRWSLPAFSRVWGRADAVVAISGAVKEWLVREQRVPASKVRVVHYGIESGPFDCSRAPSWGREDAAVIGTIGRLEPRKGHEILIQAMPRVLERYPHARLLIAGHDPYGYGQSLRFLIRRLGLSEHVELVGFVEDVPSFLRNIDVFAFASYSEGFGQVVIEAMAAGKPVIASRIAPITEIVVEGRSGLLAAPGDAVAFGEAILRVLNERFMALSMGQEARRRVEEVFCAGAMVEKMVKVYASLAQRRACRR